MSTLFKAHGMDGTLIDPDWAPLTMREVRLLLSQFSALVAPVAILTISPRPFSAASLVATKNGRVFIKRHHKSVRDRERLLEEHRFMQYLLAHGARVPRVLASDPGETAIENGDCTYEVHEASDATDLYGDALSWTPFRTAAHAHSAGQALARLHRASKGFDAPRRKVQPLVASFSIFAAECPGEALAEYLAAHPALSNNRAARLCAEDALEQLAPFHRELQPLLRSLAPLWTHNDLHASNLLWSDAGKDAQAAAIIDFGLADRTNAIHDLAHTIERNIIEWLTLVNDPTHSESVPLHFDHLRELLNGYESVRPLSDQEAAALAPMTALCHVEFALSEADYFLGILGSNEKAAMAFDGWLVGHARWFRSPAGEQLLNWLRTWATCCTASRNTT